MPFVPVPLSAKQRAEVRERLNAFIPSGGSEDLIDALGEDAEMCLLERSIRPNFAQQAAAADKIVEYASRLAKLPGGEWVAGRCGFSLGEVQRRALAHSNKARSEGAAEDPDCVGYDDFNQREPNRPKDNGFDEFFKRAADRLKEETGLHPKASGTARLACAALARILKPYVLNSGRKIADEGSYVQRAENVFYPPKPKRKTGAEVSTTKSRT